MGGRRTEDGGQRTEDGGLVEEDVGKWWMVDGGWWIDDRRSKAGTCVLQEPMLSGRVDLLRTGGLAVRYPTVRRNCPSGGSHWSKNLGNQGAT